MQYQVREIMKNENNQKKIREIGFELIDNFRGRFNFDNGELVTSLYAILKLADEQDGNLDVEFSKTRINKSIPVSYSNRDFFKVINKELWDDLVAYIKVFDSSLIAAVTIELIDATTNILKEDATSESVINLSKAVLDCQNGEKIADVCCGKGTFLFSQCQDVAAHYYGFEIYDRMVLFTKMKADILGLEFELQSMDVFDDRLDHLYPESFDKVFSNFPLAYKFAAGSNEYFTKLMESNPEITKAASSDWIFCKLLTDVLKKDGKAVGLVLTGTTYSSIDTNIRKYMLDQGLIESVIELPERILEYTNVSVSLVILSHNNKSVRLVDATSICQKGRRFNEFNDKDITQIVEALSQDSDYSKEFSMEELEAKDYVLNFSRCMAQEVVVENGVPFESVIKKISRGTAFKADQLDEMVSTEPTNIQYLLVGNIKDGIVDDQLPYLKELDKKNEKFCLKNGDLILSKNTNPIKVAVAEVKEGQKLLANGNVIVIQLDETQVNPYYIKTYLESKQGLEVLNSIAVGASMKVIALDKLKKIMVPAPELEIQNKVAEKYLQARENFKKARKQLEEALGSLHSVYDEKKGIKIARRR